MIVLHQNERVVIAESVFTMTGYGRKDQAFLVDNLPFFKAFGSNVLITGGGRNANADLDAIRYERLPFPSELTLGAIGEKIFPRVRKLLARLGRIDGDGEPMTTFIFAKGDKAYALEPDGSVCPIEEDEAFGMNRDIFRAALAMTKACRRKNGSERYSTQSENILEYIYSRSSPLTVKK